jgi:uroporphyrinogen decarboxylase
MGPLLSVLAGERVSPPPIWLMRQAGRYLPEYRQLRAEAGSFLDLCYAPRLAAEVTLQPIRRFGFDAAILFSDILVVPHALGQALWFAEGEGPRLEPIDRIDALQPFDPDDVLARLEPVFETVERVRRSLDAERALLGFCGAPWTVASYMVAGRGDRAPILEMARSAPERLAGIIDRLVEASILYLSRQVEAGADAVQIFDSWAGVLHGDDFERWCVAPIRRIVEGLRMRHPDVPVIAFPREAGTGYRRIVEAVPVNAVSIDSDLPLDFAREVLQPRVAIQGNIDPEALIAGPAAIDPALDRLHAALGQGRLIVNLGHGIRPQTPIAHVAHLVERVRGLA